MKSLVNSYKICLKFYCTSITLMFSTINLVISFRGFLSFLNLIYILHCNLAIWLSVHTFALHYFSNIVSEYVYPIKNWIEDNEDVESYNDKKSENENISGLGIRWFFTGYFFLASRHSMLCLICIFMFVIYRLQFTSNNILLYNYLVI